MFKKLTLITLLLASQRFAQVDTGAEKKIAIGPYVQKMPENLFISDAAERIAVTCVHNAPADAAPAGNEGTGWWFNAANGDFRACSADHITY